MITPIEHTPSVAYDASRQQIMPAVPVEPPPPPRLADIPLKPSDNSQNEYEQQNSQGRNGGDTAEQGRQTVAAMQALRSAWRLLEQLKQKAKQAKDSNDTNSARKVAEDAADVSLDIHRIARAVPINQALSAVADVEAIADMSASDTPLVIVPLPTDSPATGSQAPDAADPSSPGTASSRPYDGRRAPGSRAGPAGAAAQETGGTPGDAAGDGTISLSGESLTSLTSAMRSGHTPHPYSATALDGMESAISGPSYTPLDLARSSLGVAKEVVDTAASIPHLGFDDSRAIGHALRRVLDAMSGIESLAGQAADHLSRGEVMDVPATLDIRA